MKYEGLVDTVCRIYWLCQPLIDCKTLHWIEENNMVPTGKPKMGFWGVYAQRQNVKDTVEEKLGAIARESENIQVQRDNIKTVSDTISDLVG
jgi:CRISPR/Cas system-associated exonuclease Cas4 (RecB family)